MHACIVHDCQSGSDSELRLFKFPSKAKDAERRKLWEEYADQNDVPDSAAICELHFSEEQFESSQKRLKKDAVPDIVYIIRVQSEEDLEISEVVEIQHVENENVINVQNKTATPKKRKVEDNIDQIQNNSIHADIHNGVEVEIHAAKKHNDAHNGMEVEIHPAKKRKLKNKALVNAVAKPINVVLEMKEKMLQIMKKQNLAQFVNEVPQNFENQVKEIHKLKEELQVANKKIETLENVVTNIQNIYKKVFNEDQNKHLVDGSTRSTCWSEDTMNKALRLYKKCGVVGYEEILCQNLPYPSLRTLNRYRGGVTKKLDLEKKS